MLFTCGFYRIRWSVSLKSSRNDYNSNAWFNLIQCLYFRCVESKTDHLLILKVHRRMKYDINRRQRLKQTRHTSEVGLRQQCETLYFATLTDRTNERNQNCRLSILYLVCTIGHATLLKIKSETSVLGVWYVVKIGNPHVAINSIYSRSIFCR